jgi:hypothetical protein
MTYDSSNIFALYFSTRVLHRERVCNNCYPWSITRDDDRYWSLAIRVSRSEFVSPAMEPAETGRLPIAKSRVKRGGSAIAIANAMSANTLIRLC